MPRLPRLRIAGLPYHVIQRGNNRTACFVDDRDRRRYLDELATLSRSLSVAIHAYVLMTNHVHLLVTPETADGVCTLMQLLGQRYVHYFNRSHRRTGTLWEGRFRSCLVDAEGYLLTCHRYIECNPVRAGMVTSPGDYPWSSYRANALGEPDPLLSPHPVIEALGETPDVRRRVYSTLFDRALEPAALNEIRLVTNGGFALARPAFLEGRALSRRALRIGQGRRASKGKGI